MNNIHYTFCIFGSVNKWKFILTDDIGKVNLKLEKTIFANPLPFRELEQSSVEICTHMVQMWWDRVDSTSEVHVVREVDLVAHFERLSHA